MYKLGTGHMHNIVPRQRIDYINVARFKVSYILVVNYDPIFALCSP